MVLLEQINESAQTFNPKSSTAVIGLTFSSTLRAIFNPSLISFDCQYFLPLQLPVSLSVLQNLVADAPKGFGPVYAHPGINLLWQLKEWSDHPSDNLRSQLIKRNLSGFFPKLLEEFHGKLSSCLNVLPYRIVASFYSNLAHHRGGLEGDISDLGRAAIDYNPYKPGRVSTFFQKVLIFSQRTMWARQGFSSRLKDYNHLLGLLNPATLKELNKPYEIHKQIDQFLTSLDSCLIYVQTYKEIPEKTLQLAREIHQLAAAAGRQISYLLELRLKLLERSRSHEIIDY